MADIVSIKNENGAIHAIVIDSVKDGKVFIRDPWPMGTGSSYSVPVNKLEQLVTGNAVIIKP
ncbi:MAG: hypothetical protein ACK5M5_14670 [Limnobaculum xujianqingii]